MTPWKWQKGGASVLPVTLGEEENCRDSRNCASSGNEFPLIPLCVQFDDVFVAHWQSDRAGCENAQMYVGTALCRPSVWPSLGPPSHPEAQSRWVVLWQQC